MRTMLIVVAFGLCSLASLHAGFDNSPVTGTWTGPARCLHGGAETFTMVITQERDGNLSGTMDWARSSSDGRRGPQVPFTTLVVTGASIVATFTADDKTLRLQASVDGNAIAGRWSIDGDSDTWTFTGKR